MARLARYFVLGVPLHLIQRGNNRQVIFADDADFALFRPYFIPLQNLGRPPCTSTPEGSAAKGSASQEAISVSTVSACRSRVSMCQPSG